MEETGKNNLKHLVYFYGFILSDDVSEAAGRITQLFPIQINLFQGFSRFMSHALHKLL